jgi:zinc D-Ala-D-Ala carboxypeptidase
MSFNGFRRDSTAIYHLPRDAKKVLSTNFVVEEFASKDGHPVVLIHPKLVELLQALRDHFGARVAINSGYRSPAHNRAIGGAPASTHMNGTAADIVVAGVPTQRVADAARRLGAGGVKAYSTFTHVDVERVRAW